MRLWLIWLPTNNLFLNFQNHKYTVRNVRKFTKFLFHKGNVKFDDISDVFEYKYLKIAKNVLNFLKFFLILWNNWIFIKSILKLPKCPDTSIKYSTLFKWKLRKFFLNLLKSNWIFWNSILFLRNCDWIKLQSHVSGIYVENF